MLNSASQWCMAKRSSETMYLLLYSQPSLSPMNRHVWPLTCVDCDSRNLKCMRVQKGINVRIMSVCAPASVF